MTTRKAKKVKKIHGATNSPKCSACGSHGIYKIGRTGKWFCDLHFSPFPGTSSGSIIRGAKIVPSPQPSLAAKVEKARKYCERILSLSKRNEHARGMNASCKIILSILNTPTPPAKGAKRK